MTFEIEHSIPKAIVRLLGAPHDLGDLAADQGHAQALKDSTVRHHQLYAEYISDFEYAYKVAEDWWEDCVEAFVADGLTRKKAVVAAYAKRFAGPASSPEVVWFFRTYWLAFDELNLGLPPADRVPPQHALLGWLVEQGRTDYVRLLTCMPYWPIGLDENGNWC